MPTDTPAATLRLERAPAGDTLVPERKPVTVRFQWGAASPGGLLAESHIGTVQPATERRQGDAT